MLDLRSCAACIMLAQLAKQVPRFYVTTYNYIGACDLLVIWSFVWCLLAKGVAILNYSDLQSALAKTILYEI